MMKGTFQRLYTQEPKMASFTESQKFLHPHLSCLKLRHYTSPSANASENYAILIISLGYSMLYVHLQVEPNHEHTDKCVSSIIQLLLKEKQS